MKKNLLISLTSLLIFGTTINPLFGVEPDDPEFEYAKSKKYLGFARISNTPAPKDTGIWEATFFDGDGKESGPWVIQSYKSDDGKYNLLPRGRNIFSLGGDGKPSDTDCPSTDNKRFSFSASTNKGEEHTAFCGTMRPSSFPILIKGYTRKTVHKMEAGKIVDCAVYYHKNSSSDKDKALNLSTNWFDRATNSCVDCSSKTGPGCPNFTALSCPTDPNTNTPISGFTNGRIGFLKYSKSDIAQPGSDVVRGPFLLLESNGILAVPHIGYFKDFPNKYSTDCFKNYPEPQQYFPSTGNCSGVPSFIAAPGHLADIKNDNSRDTTFSLMLDGFKYSAVTNTASECFSIIYAKEGVSRINSAAGILSFIGGTTTGGTTTGGTTTGGTTTGEATTGGTTTGEATTGGTTTGGTTTATFDLNTSTYKTPLSYNSFLNIDINSVGEKIGSCSKFSGSLPSGVSLSGCRISGNVSQLGGYTVVIEAISAESKIKSHIEIKFSVARGSVNGNDVTGKVIPVTGTTSGGSPRGNSPRGGSTSGGSTTGGSTGGDSTSGSTNGGGGTGSNINDTLVPNSL